MKIYPSTLLFYSLELGPLTSDRMINSLESKSGAFSDDSMLAGYYITKVSKTESQDTDAICIQNADLVQS